jgi:fatty acid-binding protein DegV
LINYDSTTIEKFDTARTEVKLFNTVIDAMIKHGVTSKTHKVYFPECVAQERIEIFNKILQEKMPGMDTENIVLPAGIAVHVGIGAFGIQAVLKD